MVARNKSNKNRLEIYVKMCELRCLREKIPPFFFQPLVCSPSKYHTVCNNFFFECANVRSRIHRCQVSSLESKQLTQLMQGKQSSLSIYLSEFMFYIIWQIAGLSLLAQCFGLCKLREGLLMLSTHGCTRCLLLSVLSRQHEEGLERDIFT